VAFFGRRKTAIPGYCEGGKLNGLAKSKSSVDHGATFASADLNQRGIRCRLQTLQDHSGDIMTGQPSAGRAPRSFRFSSELSFQGDFDGDFHVTLP